MGASFRAEGLKLRNRPAVWILGLVWLGLTVLFGYALAYVFLVNAPPPPTPEDIPRQEREQIEQQERQFREAEIRSLLPENFVGGTVPGFANLGAAIALILGTLVVGGEYGWGTLKTIITQRPSRSQVFVGKLLALWAVLVVFAALVFLGSAAASYAIAGFENRPVEWPPVGEIGRGLGAGVLILTLWGALGAFLATLFGSTALAVGLGLVYALVLEAIVLSLPIPNDLYRDVREFFPGQNSTFLANGFAEGPFAPANPPVDPGQAALVVAAYAVAFVLLSAFVFRRRDVA